MFRYLARQLPGSTSEKLDALFSLDARAISYVMDSAWFAGGRGVVSGPFALPPTPVRVAYSAGVTTPATFTWDHLIYAYMIENSRVYEILRRVVWELLHGERMGMPLTATTNQWLRTTEALFFSDWAPTPLDLVSRIRPDLAASRRNAYYRMFGMDLNHGAEGGNAYPYEKPGVANRDFIPMFEEFLRLVWRAIENETNTSGPRETDPEAIADSALRLQNMLNARRGGSANGQTLARDEFVHVSTLAWFHLTVAADTAVVVDLRAGGPSEEERLRLIGERVGIPSHSRSHSYFQIATPISILLTEIELGSYSTPSLAPNLYVLPAGGNPIRDNVLRVINHWSMITGRDMKARLVAPSPRSEIPSITMSVSPVPSGTGAEASVSGSDVSGNGRGVAGASSGRS